MFGRATIRLGIGPHSSLLCFDTCYEMSVVKPEAWISYMIVLNVSRLYLVRYFVQYLLAAWCH